MPGGRRVVIVIVIVALPTIAAIVIVIIGVIVVIVVITGMTVFGARRVIIVIVVIRVTAPTIAAIVIVVIVGIAIGPLFATEAEEALNLVHGIFAEDAFQPAADLLVDQLLNLIVHLLMLLR